MAYHYREMERRPRTDLAYAISPDLDEHGSPVNLEAASWFVCFVPGLQKQWWHKFVHKRHKHVFAIRPEPNGMWTLFEPWWRRLLTASITPEEARKFLAWAAAGDVLLVRELIPGSGSQIRGWANCAVLVSFLLGRGYRTWSPHGFYRRLTRECGVQSVDVSMLLTLEADDLEMASQAIAVHDRGGAWMPREPLSLLKNIFGRGIGCPVRLLATIFEYLNRTLVAAATSAPLHPSDALNMRNWPVPIVNLRQVADRRELGDNPC